MSSTTADTYPESVGSCCPPTPPASPPPHPAPPPALRGAPVRQQLDFADAAADTGAAAAAGDDLDDYNDLLIRAVDDIERGYNEAKRRARACACRRGVCAVQRDDKRGRWMYVCPSQPKCKYVAMCEEVDQNPQSRPAVRSDPKPSNPFVFSIPRTPVDDARTRINNVNPQGAGATTPVNVSPQAAAAARTPSSHTFKGVGATTPDHVSPQGAGATTPVNVSPQAAVTTTTIIYTSKGVGTTTPVHISPQGAHATSVVHVSPQGAHATTAVHVSPQAAVATTPFNYTLKVSGATTPVHVSPQGVRTMTPVHVNPQGAGTTAAVKFSPQWHRANDGTPICQCTAGKCTILRVGNEDCYVCPIPNEDCQCTTPFNYTFRAAVHQESPSTPRQPIAMARTPATSPRTPLGSRSPMTPCPNSVCRECGEKGHWIMNCPKSQNKCFHCGMVGHWRANCPQRRGS